MVPQTNDFPRGFGIGENYGVRGGADASVRPGGLALLDMSGQERTAISGVAEQARADFAPIAKPAGAVGANY